MYRLWQKTIGAGQIAWSAVSKTGSSLADFETRIATDLQGVLPESKGGTNQSTYVVGDVLYASATNTLTKLTGNTSTSMKVLSQTGTGSASAAPSWEIPASQGSIIFMGANVASDIATYYQLPSLSAYTIGTLGSAAISVSTTPTLMGVFATNSGYPNITVIPSGVLGFHYETQKTAGSNNYYTYVEVWKRNLAGTETLIVTSDNTTQVSVNTKVQQSPTAFLVANVSILATDRLVLKLYGVMLSASATITVFFDDNTNARFVLPSSSVDATNFVPYSGATKDVDLGVYSASSSKALKSATTIINVSASTAPTTGQVLTATDSTHATWQNPGALIATPWPSVKSKIDIGETCTIPTDYQLIMVHGIANSGTLANSGELYII